MLEITGHVGLFWSAFFAATLLPLQSEALFVVLLAGERHMLGALLISATAGNVIGALVNWWLGRYVERFRNRRWFPASQEQLARAQRAYHRYGRWTLLLSWLPIVGDPLTVIAGVMREPLPSFLLLVTLAKLGRYTVLALLTLGWLSQ